MTQTQKGREGLAKIPEAIEFLALSRTNLYKLMDAKGLEYVKVGRSRRIPWDALRAFVARHTVGAQ